MLKVFKYLVVLVGLPGFGLGQAQQTVLDQFSSSAYNNQNGTQNWSSNWLETADGTGVATAGSIFITGDQLQIGGAAATNVGVSIQRSANLSSASMAILSFAISQTGVDATGDGMVIEISSDGTNFTVLPSGTFTNVAASTRTYNIPTYLSATTTIRFRITSALEAGEYFSLDDVQIAFSFDYGDAPDTLSGTATGNYQTQLVDNGAAHQIITGLALGVAVDGDNGTLQDAPASADDGSDTGSPDDEDGVVAFPNLPTTATTYSVDVRVSNSSGTDVYLVGYIDRNKNGTFTNTNERSATVVIPSSATNPRTFTVTFTSLSGLTAGSSYMRFRLSQTQTQAETSVGVSSSGEVEDYRIGIGVDYGDAPDTVVGTALGDYQTTSADGGASHQILTGLTLGPSIDADDGTLQNATASADGADEDGVVSFSPLLVTDTSYSVTINASNSAEATAYLVGYLDFNRDGDFGDAGERSSTVTIPSDTSNPRTFTVNFSGLSSGVTGTSYARFRLSPVQSQAESPVGLSSGGEVEDYQLEVSTLVAVSGTVFRDEDVSDTVTASDTGIANITVTIYRDDGDAVFEPGSGDGAGSSIATDPSGNYSFSAVATGNIWLVADVTDDDLPIGYLPGGRNVRFQYLALSGSSGNIFPFDPPTNSFSTCPAQAFLFQNDPTTAIVVDLVTGNYSYPPGGILPFQVNGIAYNVQDNFIYGNNTTAKDGTIVRVNANYQVTELGPIPGLPKASIVVGDTDANRRYYVYYNGRIYIIDLDPASASYLQATSVVTTSTPIADWAFNKIDGKFYAIDNNSGDLYRFNAASGAREALGYTGIPGSVASFGAAYNDPSGFLYFSNNTDGIIYRIDARNPGAVNPNAVFFSNGPASSSNDGARCLNAPVEIDFGDAPDSYGTRIASDGPRHIIPVLGSNRLGLLLDQEADGQASTGAAADDTNNLGDEDGVSLAGSPLQTQTLKTGTTVTLDIATTGSGVLNAWLDFNRDGDFLDAGEQIASDVAPSGSAIALAVTVPADAVAGISYARFRYSTDTGLAPTGPATNGEVEDYQVTLYAEIDLALTKTVNVVSPQLNDSVSYTITVTNTGPATATGVQVTDTLPAGLQFIQTLPTTACAEALAAVPTCTLGSISVGGSKSYSIEARVLTTNVLGASITNMAEVLAANQPDTDSTPNNGLNEDDRASVSVRVSGLVLEKSVCNITVLGGVCLYPSDYTTAVTGKPGDVLEYRIDYRRVGSAIFNVTLSDVLPSNTTLVQNVYGTLLGEEVILLCPDGSTVFFETGAISTISINLAASCTLGTSINPSTALPEEAVLDGESGYFMFRAKIQ